MSPNQSPDTNFSNGPNFGNISSQCNAILPGAFGRPDVGRTDGTEPAPHLDLRERIDLHCGIRPVHLHHSDHSPLNGYGRGEIDLLIIRQSTKRFFSSRPATYPPRRGQADVPEERAQAGQWQERYPGFSRWQAAGGSAGEPSRGLAGRGHHGRPR